MKLFAVLLINVLFAVKLELDGVKKGEVLKIKPHQPIFRVKVTDADPNKSYLFSATATSKTNSTTVYKIEDIKGTAAEINAKIPSLLLPTVLVEEEFFAVKALLTDDNNKTIKATYTFEAVPPIKAKHVRAKYPEKDTEFKYLELDEMDKKKDLRVNYIPEPTGMVLKVHDGHVVVEKKPAGPFPKTKFYIEDTKSGERSIDYELLAKAPKKKMSTTIKVLLAIAGVLVLFMIGIMGYFYYMSQKAQREANNTTKSGRLFVSSTTPSPEINLPLPTKAGAVDLRDVHGKPIDRI